MRRPLYKYDITDTEGNVLYSSLVRTITRTNAVQWFMKSEVYERQRGVYVITHDGEGSFTLRYRIDGSPILRLTVDLDNPL